MPHPICAALLSKLHEQIERTDHLIALLPDSRLDWVPPVAGAWPAAMLLGHLLDSIAGFCAALHTVDPRLAALRTLPVNHRCTREEARARIALYRKAIDDAFALLSDSDLSRPVPTVFVPAGEPLMTLLLGNLEHLINHKYQLFTYLKLLGLNPATRDLYHFRT